MLLEKMIQSKETGTSNESSIHKRLFVIEETAGFGENLKRMIEKQLEREVESLELAVEHGQVVIYTQTTYDKEANGDFVSFALSAVDETVAVDVSEFLNVRYDVVEF